MPSASPPHSTEPVNSGKRRSALRQRLMDAERGVRLGLRRDSTLFVHFFSGCIILAAAFVIGLTVSQWALLVLALTMVLTAELFQHVVKTFLESAAPRVSESARRAERMGTAAVFLTIAGAVLAVGLIFTQRLLEIFS